MAKSKQYYDKNPDAKKRKKAYDSTYQKSPEQVAARVRRNSDRKDAMDKGKAHKGDCMDVHHPKGNAKGPYKVISRSKNRAIK